MMRLPVPLANRMDGTPPLALLMVEGAVNWISPPPNAWTKLCPPPLDQFTAIPLAVIVALLALIAIAPPPPSFDSTMLLAVIVLPLVAPNPRPLAVTGPFTVTIELLAALIPVPKPWAVTAPFVVTLALFVAEIAVSKADCNSPNCTGCSTILNDTTVGVRRDGALSSRDLWSGDKSREYQARNYRTDGAPARMEY